MSSLVPPPVELSEPSEDKRVVRAKKRFTRRGEIYNLLYGSAIMGNLICGTKTQAEVMN